MPGEDRRLADIGGGWELEKSGKKGRMSSDDERRAAQEICDQLGIEPGQALGESGDRLSFPEVNDRLLRAFRRAKRRLQQLQSLSWSLLNETRRNRAVQEIQESEELRELLDLTGEESPDRMAEILRPKLECLRSKLPRILERIADRVLPFRNGRWVWEAHPDSSGSYILRRSRADGPARKIMGQRGLSFRRIEQLENLRRQAQGLNRALTQIPGREPVRGRATRGEEWPDPCPEILDKLNRTKEQRINQTAHMILAEALGVRLRIPQKPQELRATNDIHGEYERFRDPVDFIVLEDLSRYRSSQDRAPRENSRLMQWSHRAVLGKLKELAELYGIPVVEVNAAYSSQFCSRSGVVGFRAVELTPNRKNDRYWQRKLDRPQRAGKHKSKLTEDEKRERECVRRLFATLDKINAGRKKADKKPRTLLAPLDGGPIFVPADDSTPPMQADINAAVNLALRAIASPDCHDIHPRIRTQAEGGTVRARLGSNRERARWGGRSGRGPEVGLCDDPSAALAKQRYPNFFVDRGRVAEFDRGSIDGVEDRVAGYPGFKKNRWKVIDRLNGAKLEKWGHKHGYDEDLPW